MESSPFIFGNKPYGVTTHASDPSLPGYQEWLAHTLQKKLFVSHRLDKETTGAIIFSTTSTAAAQLTEEFSNTRVKKEYLFITDKTPPQKKWTNSNPITNEKSQKSLAAETHFEVLNEHSGFFTLRAEPQTGRTHQIRIHAANSGIPLLGDSKYGGTRFAHFFLHCERISIPALQIEHSALPPIVFSQPALLRQPLLVQWLMSVDRRQRLYENLSSCAYRWIHEEDTPLRLDILGAKGCAGWWRDTPPTANELKTLEEFFALMKLSEWRLMHYSGQRLQDKPIVDLIYTSSWTGRENDLQLEFRKESGLSCGLFLDQRDNRAWTWAQAKQKNVLNLFAYTGAFSVAAALGGASKVTTVDLSKNYVEWSKTNFSLNQLNIEDHGFYAMDSMEYLKYAAKKQLQFDLVICDPPSFSRDKKGNVFRIERDFAELLKAICKTLSTNGIVLFSTNYEKWTSERWLQELQRELYSEQLEITEKLSFQWDFETSHNRHMKAFLLQKK